MAGRAGLGLTVMIEVGGCPGKGGVATAAIPVAGWDVAGAFSSGRGTVMACGAGGRYVVVVEMRWHPGQGAVATTTFHIEGGDMIDRFAGGRAAVVAVGTGLGNLAMIENRRCPALGGMAVVAVIVGGDVSGWLAAAGYSVMAIAASDAYFGMIHAGDGGPGVDTVAAVATFAGGNMFIVFAGGHDTATTTVASATGARGALEHALRVTAGAVGIDVAACKGEGRHAVIEAFARFVGVVDCDKREQQCGYQQCADG